MLAIHAMVPISCAVCSSRYTEASLPPISGGDSAGLYGYWRAHDPRIMSHVSPKSGPLLAAQDGWIAWRTPCAAVNVTIVRSAAEVAPQLEIVKL